MPETNTHRDELDAAMNEVQPRGRTKSQRKAAHRKQDTPRPTDGGVSSPTVDALWALVESYATHRSVNVNGPDPSFDEAKASLQGALQALVAQATARPQLQLPDCKVQDRMNPGDTDESYARHEGRVEGWNECLEEITRLNAQSGTSAIPFGPDIQTAPYWTLQAHLVKQPSDLPEPACYLLNGTSKLAETCESSYAVLVRTADGPGERMPLFTADQLRGQRTPPFTRARITRLLEELRERCAGMAEDTIVAEFEGIDRYGDKAAERIRTIELDVAVRQFFAAGAVGRPATHKLVPLELPDDVQRAAQIWESMGVKKTYAELWQFMLSKIPDGEVSHG